MSTPKQAPKDNTSSANEQIPSAAPLNGNEEAFRSYQNNPYQQQAQVSQGYYFGQAGATTSQANQQAPAPAANGYAGYQQYQQYPGYPNAAATQYGDYKYNYQPQAATQYAAATAAPTAAVPSYQPMTNPYQSGVQPSAIGQIQPVGSRPRVTTTMWEDEKTLCYQVDANGVSVVRRADNNMINGTKLLNVAHMTRGRRDGILKSEKVRDVVKIGSMHLKGVWIPFERALAMAQKEGIVDLLYPLFVRDIKQVIQQGSTTQPNQVPQYNYAQQTTSTAGTTSTASVPSAQPAPTVSQPNSTTTAQPSATSASAQPAANTTNFGYGTQYGGQSYYGNGTYQQPTQTSPQQQGQIQTGSTNNSTTVTGAPQQYQTTGYPGYQQYQYGSYQVPQPTGQYYQQTGAPVVPQQSNVASSGSNASTNSSNNLNSNAAGTTNTTGATGAVTSHSTTSATGATPASNGSALPNSNGYTQYQYGYPSNYGQYSAQPTASAPTQLNDEKYSK